MMPLVSISDAQRAPLAWANWYGTVHHGLPTDLYGLGPGDGGYLAFVGRISPEKGVERAVQIAQRARLPLKIAAKVDKADLDYYNRRIKRLLKNPGVEFIGEIDERGKREFLGRALALLFPIDWPEPFGLVMIEAMANGTPVIAFRRGSVPEILEDGVSGFVLDGVGEAVAAVPRALSLDRASIRRRFEQRFSVGRMARDYVALYTEVLRRGSVGAVVMNATPAGQRDAA
jgi:glycosyltransferase involved in cell wall biosynthesis